MKKGITKPTSNEIVEKAQLKLSCWKSKLLIRSLSYLGSAYENYGRPVIVRVRYNSRKNKSILFSRQGLFLTERKQTLHFIKETRGEDRFV